MATTLLGETWIEGREGSSDTENNREYTRYFKVQTSSALIGARAVLATAGLPAQFDSYADQAGNVDLYSVALRARARQDSEVPTLWVVEVEYGSRPTKDPAQYIENPLERPAEWQFSGEQFTKPATRGRYVTGQTVEDGVLTADGTPGPDVVAITNSALVPYDPPAEMDDSRPVLIITRNEVSFDPAVALAYADAVNADYFFGVRPGQAKMKMPTARNAHESGIKYAVVTYEIHFRPEGWDISLLDQGLEERVSGDLRVITDPSTGTVVSTPQLLDGGGFKNDPDDPPVYRVYRVYRRKNFGALGLIQT